MALIVEDGSIVAGADSWASVVEADALLDAKGCVSWGTLQTVEKEAALRRAATFMEQSFQMRWLGDRVSPDQVLSWPRSGAIVFGYQLGSATIPEAVKAAQIEMAFKAAAGDLNPDITTGVTKEKVDVIELEYDAARTGALDYRALRQALAPYLRDGGGGNGFSQARVQRS